MYRSYYVIMYRSCNTNMFWYYDVFSWGSVGPVIRTLITKWDDLQNRMRQYLAGDIRPLLGTSCGVPGRCWVVAGVASMSDCWWPVMWLIVTICDRWCDCVTAVAMMGIPVPARPGSDMMNNIMLYSRLPVQFLCCISCWLFLGVGFRPVVGKGGPVHVLVVLSGVLLAWVYLCT